LSLIGEGVRHQFGQFFREITCSISHQEAVAMAQIGSSERVGILMHEGALGERGGRRLQTP
jgi:hypothetical protein